MELEAANSWAVITSTLQDAQVKPGDQAVLLDPGSVRLRRPVRAISQSGLPEGLDQQAALDRARAAIQAGGTQFAPLAADGEPAYFQIAVNNRAEYEIWDAAGSVIPNLFPALDSGLAAPEALARRLEHLAKYQNVRELENHDSLSPLARSLLVEIAGKQAEYDPADPPDPQPVDFSDEIVTIRDGEWIFVRVKNLLPPVPDSLTANLLNIAILDLQPGWGITQVYPSAPAALFEPLDPGSQLLLPFRTHLPDAYTAATDVIKVMATVDTTSFRWLDCRPSTPTTRPRCAHAGGRRTHSNRFSPAWFKSHVPATWTLLRTQARLGQLPRSRSTSADLCRASSRSTSADLCRGFLCLLSARSE